MLVTASKLKSQAWSRFIGSFNLGTLHCGIEIVVDGRAINNPRDLIALVVVKEDVSVECDGTVQQRIFGSQLKGIYKFRFEGQRMNGVGNPLFVKNQQGSARRICAACLISMRVGSVDKCLIGEIELRGPIGRKPAG